MKIRQLSVLARELIPGSNGLLSKRAEMFAPEVWPEFFDRAEGIVVTDIEGNNYRDFANFSVGTCTLGYQHPDVDQAVIDVIRKGTMSTLNPPEEVYLAQKLVKMHPWSAMVRFARTGGEANAISVRIARAFTNKSKIAFCGYHGWHDWYLSANLKDKSNLDQQLMSGLSPRGVPNDLAGTSKPFSASDLEALEAILKQGDIAAVKMEVMRSHEPTIEYLLAVKDLAKRYGALLIFDECTSGFRETFGGLHLKYGVSPDLCVLGKTVGNGYPLTAVVGTKEVMMASQDSFISSTFFTERVGFVAALKTLEVMESVRSWDQITALGKYFRKKITDTFQKNGYVIDITGLSALTTYVIEHPNYSLIKTYLTQEMLKEGYLMSGQFYPSIAHTRDDIDHFCSALMGVLSRIPDPLTPESLQGPICHTGFERLN